MSKDQDGDKKPLPYGQLATRLIRGAVAVGALVAAVYLITVRRDLATAATSPALIRDHVPAALGIPILAALSTAIVCGARAHDAGSQVELLGLRAEGASAAVLSWVVVFGVLVTALRALW